MKFHIIISFFDQIKITGMEFNSFKLAESNGRFSTGLGFSDVFMIQKGQQRIQGIRKTALTIYSIET